jgi:biopolymer transport protein ExbB
VDQETFSDFIWLAFDGRIGQVVLLLLTFMSAGALGITIDRILRYKAAHKDSEDFRQQVSVSLRDHNLDELILIAQRNNSPRAVVIASGLSAFLQARSVSSDAFAFEAAKRASQLSARAVHFRMSRGLNHVGAIIATVLFVGVFGTCYGFLTAFKGCGCSMESLKAALAYEHSRALVPTALSSLVAVPTIWVHRYLESKINWFDLEMETASLELVNYLVFHVEREKLSKSLSIVPKLDQ